MPHITGFFSDPDDANDAFAALEALGFKHEDISVVMSNQTRKNYFSSGDAADGPIEANATAGAITGGVIGALVGAAVVAGGALATGGLVFATGPIGIALATIGATAAAGGVIGAIAKAGIPEEDHQSIADAVAHGQIVISVDASAAQADPVMKILRGRQDPTHAA